MVSPFRKIGDLTIHLMLDFRSDFMLALDLDRIESSFGSNQQVDLTSFAGMTSFHFSIGRGEFDQCAA